MQLKKTIVSAAGAAGVVFTVGHASAAPPNVSVEGPASAVTTAAERCWWRHGVRHCRWLGQHYYGYRSRYREYNNPDAYRTGSSHWWQEMDRLDRGGRGRP
jgi:hypothetical protein